MNQENKSGHNKNGLIISIFLFVVLYLIISLATLVKFLFVLSGKFTLERGLSFLTAEVILLLVVFVYALYCLMTRSRLLQKPKELAVVCTCVAVGFSVCILCESVSVFLCPMFLAAFLLAPLVRRRDTFMANIFCIFLVLGCLMAQYNVTGGGTVPLMTMAVAGLLGGTLVAFVLNDERKRLDFLVKGLAICLGCILLVFVLIYPGAELAADGKKMFSDLLDDGKWSIIAIFSQLLLSLIFQPILEKLFNLVTNSRLIELTDHNTPLIKRLIEEAPGTFNHCLAVANFAEVCATAIGENPYMARAAAYYHDIGKLANPMFFKENQHGDNPHDKILPEVSVEIIRSHTVEGYKLCQKYHVPEEVAAVTVEHHGTLPISMFFSKARELTDGEVDVKEYSYSGSLPTGKITAIIMICDASEAALRAMDSPDAKKAEQLLDKLILSRIQSGQFDNCDITLRELDIIQETIVGAYGGVFHKRIIYPENNEN